MISSAAANRQAVRHTVLDANVQYVSESMFDPTKGARVSSHAISKLGGTVCVTRMCNIHDVWLNTLTL